jgi:hypothetical protein
MTAPPRAQLVIQITVDGQIQVHGPIQDKMLCYGLLECARDAIREFDAKAAQSKIVQARPADPFLMRGHNGKGS